MSFRLDRKRSIRWCSGVLAVQSCLCWHGALAEDNVLKDPTFLVAIILGAMTLVILIVLVALAMKYRQLRRRLRVAQGAAYPKTCRHCGGNLTPQRQRSHSAPWIEQPDGNGEAVQHHYQESAYAYCRTGRVQSVPRHLNHPSFTTTTDPSADPSHQSARSTSAARRVFANTGLRSRTSSGPNLSVIAGEYQPQKPASMLMQRNVMSLQTSPDMKRKFSANSSSMGNRQSSLPLLSDMFPASGNSSLGSNSEDIHQRMLQLGAPTVTLDESNSAASMRAAFRQRPVQSGGEGSDFPSQQPSSQDRWMADRFRQRSLHASDTDDTDARSTAAIRSKIPSPSTPYIYRDSADFSTKRAQSADNVSQPTSPVQPDGPNHRNGGTPPALPTGSYPSSPVDESKGKKPAEEPFFIPQFRKFPTPLHSLEEEPMAMPDDLILRIGRNAEARYLEANSYRSVASSAGRTVDTLSTGCVSSMDGMSTDTGCTTEEQMTDPEALQRQKKKRSTRRRSQEGAQKPSHPRVTFLQLDQPPSHNRFTYSTDLAGMNAAFGSGPDSVPLKHTDFSDSDAAPECSSAAASVISTYAVPKPAVPAIMGRYRNGRAHLYDTPTEPASPPVAARTSSDVRTMKMNGGSPVIAGASAVSSPRTPGRSKLDGSGMDDESPFLRPAHHSHQFSTASSAQSSFQFTPGTCEVNLGN